MHIDHRRHVKDIASASEAAKSVLESCGVDFCCKGEASLREACIHAAVDPSEVEQRLRELPETPNQVWDDVSSLVDHVVEMCHPATRDAIKHARSVAGHGALADALDVLERSALARMHDDEVLFRHVRALADARSGRGPFPLGPFATIRSQGHSLREAHARLHDHLRHVRAIASSPEVDTIPIRRAVDHLAHALVEQMHLVNNELIPRAKALEPE
jgi:regulator of cell morphogenesis and NO signaling